MKKEIEKKEIRYAVHLFQNPSIDRPDLHYVKEVVTYKDGTKEPRCFFVENFKRPVWVTKEGDRNHKDKKEFEDRDKLNKITTTQSDLTKTLATALGTPHLATQPKRVNASPYIYGAETTSSSLIKLSSLKKNDFIESPYTVAAADIETTVDDPKTILIKTIAYNGHIYTAVKKSFLQGIGDPAARVRAAIDFYLPKYKHWELHLTVHETEIELLKEIFRVANKVKPDFLSYWNIHFDMSVMFDRMKHFGVNPIDVIADQSIPRNYRTCRFKEGPRLKVTSSGVGKPINPSLQWHSLISTSGFYAIDAMCAYRQLRLAKQEEPSYSLDAILKKEIKSQKLKFAEADEYKGVKWHIFMQEKYPVEYIVYNIYDCLGILELDEKTKDLSSSLPSFAGITEFQKFSSQVRKISDALFLFGLESNSIMGVAAPIETNDGYSDETADDDEDEEEDDDDDPRKYKTLGLKGWIQLLPQDHLLRNGLKCLEDFPDVATNIRGIVVDQDSVSSYPSCIVVSNNSKETTLNELISIEGITEPVFREQNLSICLGNSNMLEYCSVMFGLPDISEIDMAQF